MKFISKKNFIPLALAGAMALGSAALCAGVPARTASAAEDTQAVYTHTAPQENGIMPLECTQSSIRIPLEPRNGQSHRFMVSYEIAQDDKEADLIYGYSGASDRYPSAYFPAEYGKPTRYVMMAQYSTKPQASIFVLRTHCTRCNITSAGINVFRDANEIIANRVPKAYKISGTIPTAYKEGENQWDHGGNSNYKIEFSIAYNGEVRDGEVPIPGMFFKYADEINIGDNTFYVRTGPGVVTIKAKYAVKCNSYNTMFAFDLVKNK